MVALLDVNVLVALFDPDHPQSDRVAKWFQSHAASGWSTCAITENGFVRILAQPSYPHPISLYQGLTTLARACAHAYHEFWPCDVSITDPMAVKADHVLGPSQLTDIYLLSLAVHHKGSFVTLDRRITAQAVPGAEETNLVVL